MMTIEQAYQAYRDGKITYEQYRREYADPVEAERLARKWQECRRAAR